MVRRAAIAWKTLFATGGAARINKKGKETIMTMRLFPPAPTRLAARRAIFLVLVTLAMTGPIWAGDWPQFRGPNCSGLSTLR